MASITKIKNPANPWRVYIRRVGHPDISKLFPTNVEAKRWARAEEAKLDKNPTANTGAALTMSELIASYTKEFINDQEGGLSQKRRQALRGVLTNLRQIDQHLGRYRLKELTLEIFENFSKIPRSKSCASKKMEGKPLAGKTLHSKLGLVKMVLRHGGVMQGAESPCVNAIAKMDTLILKLRKKNLLHKNSRDRRPTISELEMLEAYFAALPTGQNYRTRTPVWEMVLFAIATCMRRSEITKIVWEDFDPIKRTIWIMDRKDPSGGHGRNDLVPLLKGAFVWRGVPVDPIAIMSDLAFRTGRARKGRAFPYNPNHVSAHFKRACDACGIEDLRFHDLRHEGVSRLFEDKRPMEEVSIVSGHRSWTDLKRYTNLKPENLHRDQARLVFD